MDSAECLRGRKLWMMGSRGRLAEESRSMKQLENFSPKGLKVLVVDDDPLCLIVLERMLKQCDYSVTTCTRVKEAISMAMEKKDRFDLVMSEVYMQDEGGFRLLEIIGLMLDLPVIMMSANADTDMVMKGITHGACDYLIKPVRMEELRNIWQHVVRRKGRESLREEYGESDHDHETKVMESSSESTSKKRKDSQNLESPTEIIDDISSLKKTRIHWTVQLHQQFVAAVNRLGIDKAVPKKIIEIMGVQGLTRENVASHLQKYRLYLKRLSGAVPEPYPVASFQAAEDGKAGGAMHVQAGGKGSHAAASSASSPAQIKGSNLGAGVNPKGCFRMGRIDPATLKSLEQYRAYEQKLAANRAQVLGGIGIVPSKQSNVGQLSDKKSTSGLLRMQSVDLSLLWKAQRDQTETETATNQKPADDSVTQTLKIPMKVEDIVGDAESCKASSFRHSRTRSMSYWPTHSFPLSTTTPKESILLEDSTSKDMQQEVDDLFDSFVEEDYEIPSFPETHPHPQRSGSAGFQDTSGSVNPDSLSYSVDDISGYLLEDILPKPT